MGPPGIRPARGWQRPRRRAAPADGRGRAAGRGRRARSGAARRAGHHLDGVLPAGPGEHPNGALAVDHVVAFTDDLDRTVAALERAGAALRRRAEPRPGTPMAFHRLGPLVLEVVGGRDGPALWGLVVVVADLDGCARELGPLVGPARDAVQPGRQIATVRPGAGLPVALALMTPQPRPANSVGE